MSKEELDTKAGFLVAGAVQKGIQNRTIYLGAIKKSFESTIKELNSTKLNLQV